MRFEMLKDNIGVWHECMPRWWCNELIAMFDDILKEVQDANPEIGENDDAHRFMFRNNEKRTDVSTTLESFEDFATFEYELKRKLEECTEEYWHEVAGQYTGERSPWRKQLEQVETKIQRTPPGGGFSAWHYEQGSDYHCSRRFGVWMIYLNDVNKGGKTDFPNQGLSVKPEAGKMVIWPAAYTHMHRSAPDLEEWKYIVTGWFIYKDANDKQNDREFEPSRIRESSS